MGKKSNAAVADHSEEVQDVLDELEALSQPDVEAVVAAIADNGVEPLTLDEVADPGDPVDHEQDECVVDIEELAALERIIAPNNNFLPVAFLEEGVVRQKAVARIALRQAHRGLSAGSGWGTGWLVANDLLMTNNHVIPDENFARTMAKAEFNYQRDLDGQAQQTDTYNLDPDSFFYTNAALDFTLVRVKCRSLWLPNIPFRVRPIPGGEYMVVPEYTPDPTAPVGGFGGIGTTFTQPGTTVDLTDITGPALRPTFCVSPGTRWGWLNLPSSGVSYATDMHINIVQHPRGRRKEVAVQENQLTNTYTNHVRYTTDTEPGSSGSPVFNNQWDLLAIHHAGGERVNGVWINNQGVRIDKIVADIVANVPASIRTALGL